MVCAEVILGTASTALTVLAPTREPNSQRLGRATVSTCSRRPAAQAPARLPGLVDMDTVAVVPAAQTECTEQQTAEPSAVLQGEAPAVGSSSSSSEVAQPEAPGGCATPAQGPTTGISTESCNSCLPSRRSEADGPSHRPAANVSRSSPQVPPGSRPTPAALPRPNLAQGRPRSAHSQQSRAQPQHLNHAHHQGRLPSMYPPWMQPSPGVGMPGGTYASVPYPPYHMQAYPIYVNGISGALPGSTAGQPPPYMHMYGVDPYAYHLAAGMHGPNGRPHPSQRRGSMQPPLGHANMHMQPPPPFLPGMPPGALGPAMLAPGMHPHAPQGYGQLGFAPMYGMHPAPYGPASYGMPAWPLLPPQHGFPQAAMQTMPYQAHIPPPHPPPEPPQQASASRTAPRRWGKAQSSSQPVAWQPVSSESKSSTAAPSEQEGSCDGKASTPEHSVGQIDLDDPSSISDADDDEDDEDVGVAPPELPPAPEVCDSWEWLPEGVLAGVLAHLDSRTLKRFRLACRRWKLVADRNLTALRPSKAKVHTVVCQFPSVSSIDLSGCQNVRNRNLQILARSELRLTSLAIGHEGFSAYGKPRITNQALKEVAVLTGLTDLTLSDCSAITNQGLGELTTLRALRRLAITRCQRISDKGITPLLQLPCLEALNLYGAVKITDALPGALAGLTQLISLNLGFTRVQDAGVRQLAALPCLGELGLAGLNDISDDALLSLAALTCLTHLDLTGVPLVSWVELARSLPGLRHLHLQGCTGVAEAHLVALTMDGVDGSVPPLDEIRLPSRAVGPLGVEMLAHLSSLRRLCLEYYWPEGPAEPPECLSALTQLTSLEVKGKVYEAAMLRAISTLPRLAELSLIDINSLARTAPSPAMLRALAACRGLRTLDLAHISLDDSQVRMLLQKLSSLERLGLMSCLKGEAPEASLGLAQLQRDFPHVELQCSHRQRVQQGTAA